MENKRLEYLDYARGLAILLVILGHIYDSSNHIKIWFCSFHLSLFFIISGILCKYTNVEKRNLKNIIISRFKTLILPYIFFELLAILTWMIQNDFTLRALKWNIIDSVLMYCKAGATWFLPTLFISEILFICMVKYIKNIKIDLVISLLIYLIPFIIKTENHYVTVVIRCFTAFGFLSLGYFMSNIFIKNDLNIKIIVILLMINIILSNFNNLVDLWCLKFENPLLYTINAVLGSAFIIFSLKKIKYNKFLKYIGTNTVIIMSTQQVILEVINAITKKQYYNNETGLLIFVIILILEIPIIEIINRYLPFMLGKFPKKKKIQTITD